MEPQRITITDDKPGEPWHVVFNATCRLAVVCERSGTRIEFPLLAGQAVTVTGGFSDVRFEILDATLPGYGAALQLVSPAAPGHS